MDIHPELRALRGDDSPQRDAQEALHQAMAGWRGKPEVAALIDSLTAFANGAALADCPELAALFEAGNGAAPALAADFTAATAEALAAAPLGHVPLRHFTDGVSSTLLLIRTGNVTLSLVAIDGLGLHGKPEPATARFGPNQTWEHVLTGRADAELVECQPSGPRQAELHRKAVSIEPGTVAFRDGEHEARLLHHIDGALVSLRLQRRWEGAGPTREYDLATGALLRQTAGNPRDSRIELMLALLGRMGRKDAAPLMAELARDEGSTALRWQALRECLALDTLAGFQTLCAVAAAPGDALAGPAGALRAQLVEAHPQLQEFAPCPA